MYKTIIVVVQNTKDAETAALNLPHNETLKRFFVYVDERPLPSELLWKTNDDFYIVLEKAINLNDAAFEIAFRAGILYTKADQFIFCMSNDTPNEQIINKTFNTLIHSYEMNIIKEDNFIALNREYILYYGFEEIYKQIKYMNRSTTISKISLAQTMAGEPSTLADAIKALKEFVDLDTLYIEGREEDITPTIQEIAYNFRHRSDENANVILYQYSKNPITFKEEFNRLIGCIPNNGLVILVTTEGDYIEQIAKPFQKFNLLTGEAMFLYTK